MKFFSGEKLKKDKTENPLKSEHLREGVGPIIACVGTPRQFKEGGSDAIPEVFSDPSLNQSNNSNRNVNYYGNPAELKSQKFKNAGHHSYVISPVDSSNKFSESFKNCTGLIITGLDRETGKDISFLSHQDPRYFLSGTYDTETFVDDLRNQLTELKKRCIDRTIDAVIVGGNYFQDPNRQKFREDYIASIELISKEVKDLLGFEPVVITGPKTVSGRDDVFYDNDHRRLYIMRPGVAMESTKSYLPSNIENQEEKW